MARASSPPDGVPLLEGRVPGSVLARSPSGFSGSMGNTRKAAPKIRISFASISDRSRLMNRVSLYPDYASGVLDTFLSVL
ncbi:hypothetical protein D3C85_1513420 [compost metagenome]